MKVIKNGQYYIAADGSKSGCYVIDCESFKHCNDVVVKRFTASGIDEKTSRIDAFKLTMVRYYLVSKKPEWLNCEANNARL